MILYERSIKNVTELIIFFAKEKFKSSLMLAIKLLTLQFSKTDERLCLII